MKNKIFKYIYLILSAIYLLNGCGGGSSGSGGGSPSGAGISQTSGNGSSSRGGSSAPPSTYTISGTLTGLSSGAKVVLQNNGADAVTLSTNGAFTFVTPLASGKTYSVVVSNQPANQNCYLAKNTNSGTIAATNVTSVSVNCQAGTSAFTISLSNDIIAAGQSSNLSWSGTNISNCIASGAWSGNQTVIGSYAITEAIPGYYANYLTCDTPSGVLTQAAVLTVFGQTPVTQKSSMPNVNWYSASIVTPPSNPIVGFQTTITVPPLLSASSNSSAFIAVWPGLESLSNGDNFLPINAGILQPVLESSQGSQTSQSWTAVSAYDNQNGLPPIISGYQELSSQLAYGNNSFNSSNSFHPQPGDVIVESMTLDQTSGYWTVNLTDTTLNQSNTLIMNMQGQAQNYAVLAIEAWYGMTTPYPIVFTNSTITLSSPDTTGVCSNSLGQANNYVMTPPALDNTQTKCSIAQVILVQN